MIRKYNKHDNELLHINGNSIEMLSWAKVGPPSAVGSESDCESWVSGSSPGPATYFRGDLS